MALFITFEGVEGSGKSTQASLLAKRMAQENYSVILTHEPGGTVLGEKITQLLKWDRNSEINGLSEVYLFNASRAQLVRDVLLPKLADNVNVICDRYTDSTMAYQGYGRGLELTTVSRLNEIASGGLKPDLTVLLDIELQQAFLRKKNDNKDRFEEAALAFHQRVRSGFLALARSEAERFFVLDGNQPKEKIAGIIWRKVRLLLK
jgi:dTMP kinase